MTVISNLMLVIVLLCVVSLHVASPKPHSRTRKSADGEKEDCYNITKDKWLNYQILKLSAVETEDGCKPLYCYKFAKNTYLRYYVLHSTDVESEDECKLLCEKNNKCGTYRINRRVRPFRCDLFKKPVIFAAFNTNLEECIKKCTAMKECKILTNLANILGVVFSF
ncbi:hypothetical protein LOTGIDRAFT_171605 [Lottia gigantea]|uniref:Apple domain-containing protein n=1 Tax=Lottia gigantea TaxID=225164 RepID=V4AZU1_LOTGI|nr:hypothetical protein LOTGIDRAFT_171605 [Lottia gigantea]ESP03258.1 hypothetical protein LOTGIDRAFT_171605 [Lottia gigantea]